MPANQEVGDDVLPPRQSRSAGRTIESRLVPTLQTLDVLAAILGVTLPSSGGAIESRNREGVQFNLKISQKRRDARRIIRAGGHFGIYNRTNDNGSISKR